MERSPYEPPGATVKDQPDVAPPQPPQVARAIRLLWAVLAASLVSLLPLFRGTWWVIPDASASPAAGLAVGVVVTVIWSGIMIALIRRLNRRRNWARWVLLGYLSIGWIALAIDLPSTLEATPFAGMIDVVVAICELSASYLLFLSPGAEWFKRQRAS